MVGVLMHGIDNLLFGVYFFKIRFCEVSGLFIGDFSRCPTDGSVSGNSSGSLLLPKEIAHPLEIPENFGRGYIAAFKISEYAAQGWFGLLGIKNIGQNIAGRLHGFSVADDFNDCHTEFLSTGKTQAE